ncbi:alpha/beta hydrolase [Cereibacter sphaeroides]|uniref:alpha/beta fold hydrolase n=1 Tax=Cereibacter sphaeroides TaxID=1063 RepID=UPI001F25D4B5|nr:alpha/beta hydrolase [Cereibacter sphaeroides]MCE6958144.1 alpha/beta hydrolase [Cereibacter sphaeroides]MCE6971796.1 alpha/beta hydrolase [Cereibacter sphaeroides]
MPLFSRKEDAMDRSFCLTACVVIAFPLAVTAQEPETKQVEAAGASFPVVEVGKGEPVLFVHGAFGDYRAWDLVRDAASKGHRFIAYTQRHFGTSDWPDEPVYGRDVHESDLTALLDTWSEPVHLVGWSYSGPIVLQAALDRPDLVRKVAIYEPTLETVLQDKKEYEQVMADWNASWGPIVEASQGGDDEKAIRLGLEAVFGLPEGGFRTLPEGAQTMFLENAHTVPKMLAAPSSIPMTCADLGGIQAPVLILYGSDTLPFFEAAAKEVARCLPNATLDEMSGEGHGAPLQNSDAVIEEVLAFIDARSD